MGFGVSFDRGGRVEQQFKRRSNGFPFATDCASSLTTELDCLARYPHRPGDQNQPGQTGSERPMADGSGQSQIRPGFATPKAVHEIEHRVYRALE